MVNKSKKQRQFLQRGCASASKKYKKHKQLRLRGGSHFSHEFSNKVLPPVPNALNGPAWSPTNMGSNHYGKNNYNAQVDYNPKQEGNQIHLFGKNWGKMWGGKRKQKTRKLGTKQKGGNILNQLIPSDLLNVGR